MTERNENLSQFFGCYFHQDWNLDEPMWQAVVKRFVEDSGSEAANSVAQEIATLLEVSSDARLPQALVDLGCDYWPGSPTEARTWLQNVSETLQAGT